MGWKKIEPGISQIYDLYKEAALYGQGIIYLKYEQEQEEEDMLDGIKLWVKDLTIDKQIELISVLSPRKGVIGHGGLGHSHAYVIEKGDAILHDYVGLTKVSFYQMPEKEANVDYLLSLKRGEVIDRSMLFESDLDRYFRLANLGPPVEPIDADWSRYGYGKKLSVPNCNHDFIPIRGLSMILGYDCKKCGIKQEDSL